MDENQLETNFSQPQTLEPTSVDNSQVEVEEDTFPDESLLEGQSQDPSSSLILGKFKSVEDLTKAYQELQKYQGQNSEELGQLRKESNSTNGLFDSLVQAIVMSDELSNSIKETREKYDTPEYFQDECFKELYKEAFYALKNDLDSDKFIGLLENYVNSRLALNEKNKLAEAETQKVLDSMTYSKNPKSMLAQPKKSLDEMTSQEIDELLEKYI